MTRSKRTRGFTLVELMVVVGLIMLLVGLSLPNLLHSRSAANEASAIATLKAVQSAQAIRLERSGTVGSLPTLVTESYLPESLEDGVQSGYGFYVRVGRREYSGLSAAVAWPVKPGMTGDHVMLITPDGKIYRVNREWKSGKKAKRFATRNAYLKKFNEKVLVRQQWSLVGQ
jgi:prepilin-type N-terminal cleavage/methylation domain-containing protein